MADEKRKKKMSKKSIPLMVVLVICIVALGISIWQLVIIAVIVVLLFGTKKLGSIGSDLGASIKGFKKAMSDDENKQEKTSQDADFTAKSIADKQDEAKKEEAKRHDKEQV